MEITDVPFRDMFLVGLTMLGTLTFAEFAGSKQKCCTACALAFALFALSFAFGAPVIRLLTSFIMAFIFYKVFSHDDEERKPNEEPKKKRMTGVK